MRTICVWVLAAAVWPSAAWCEETPVAKAGDVILEVDFEATDALAAWPGRMGTPKLGAGCGGGRALCIESADASSGANVSIVLPAKRLRGCKVLLSAMVKAENVSDRPNAWNGIKFMAPIDAESGKTWPQATIGVGSFDWRPVVWLARVPEDARAMSLVLGLERVTGKVWFDSVKVSVRRGPVTPKPRRPGPVYKGHDLPRLRGAMVSPNATADDLRTFGREWGANCIRWQLFGFKPGFDTADLKEYDRRLEAELKKLDAAIPVCEEVGLVVVVDLHTGPGHWAEPPRSLFTSRRMQDRFVEIWEQIARRYKDARCIWGYDLLNEPLEEGAADDTLDWQELAEKTARAIRKIDPRRCLIVEPAPWGGPDALKQFLPIDVPGVVYSVHMYNPFAFTHQGVFDLKQKAVRYPGEIDGRMWDRAALEASLGPAIAFQKTYGVHIYLGEFSAIRWAPDQSACRYISDCIEIFEKHGWDWTYHAFREWSGWSVEHGEDRADDAPTKEPTDRKKLLLEWFAKNTKPAWTKTR
ncbi:MAG TPA: cellulase family glycosylhydrolase [Phycisphaerae bacterium]|nr:cellulase family glycosylhydrolase [Phycisphaerae bacterium]